MVNKVLCGECRRPAEFVTEPNFAFVCFFCGNESVISYDSHWHEVRIDPEKFESDGFTVSNPVLHDNGYE